MLKSRRNEALVALVLVAPFVAIYGWLFIYPTIQMVRLSFTNAPLIGAGEWTGIENYKRLFSDRVFQTAIFNTAYFVVLTVVPGTAAALAIALMVSRLKGWTQSLVLAAFFLPFILPVTVVYLIWWWMTDYQFGILQYVIEPIVGSPVNVFRRAPWFLPMAALVTVWWTNGFSILLFLAGLRNISPEVQEAAELDGATRWQRFRHVTWPLIWPVTVLCLTIQLILQLKIFDQVYLFSIGGRTNQTMVLVQYIYEQAFVHNKGGYGATVAVALFLIIVCFSVLQFQALKARGERLTTTAPTVATAQTQARSSRLSTYNAVGLGLTLVTVIAAIIWAFPLYWLVITTLKPEDEVVRPYVEFWPDTFTFASYVHIITNTRLGQWYLNSLVTATAVTVLVVFMGACCGYAISQLRFPGRRLLWWTILASFMVPIQALIVNHFIIMADVKLLNTWLGIILPQLIAPVIIIVYKQFFDSVPREFREAAVIDGANEFQLLFRIFLPMNWGVTTALAIITFIAAWNAFLWPFLVSKTEDMMTVTVGITEVQDAFGIYYARLLAGAVLAGLPVAIVYLIFQRRVTQAIMLTAGVKG